MKDFAAVSKHYAQGVVAGAIPAGNLVFQACKRQLEELEKPPTGYRFDAELGRRACAFVELCPHVKGELAKAGQLITLEPWQVFIVCTVFGWVDENGNRRFRQVYIEVPRGNGKSSLSAPIGLYMLVADGEAGAEVYSAATTRDQARIVFRDAQAMARKMPSLYKYFGLEVHANAISVLETNSTFQPLSADGHTLDGLNVHLAVIDELHAHKKRDVYDVLETGLGKRPQSLLWVITTAGFNKHGICYEVRGYASKVLAGEVADDSFFAVIYTIDKDDDPYSEESLRKANPNWGVSVDPKKVLQIAAKARQVATARANYLTKHLDLWVDANEALFDTTHWKAGGDRELVETDFHDCPSVTALDLASKIDVAAKVNLYEKMVDGREHYFVFPTFYLPETAIEEDRHPLYRGWSMSEQLVATPGETIDFASIEDEVKLEVPGRNIKAVLADPWQANYLIQNLQREGYPCEEYRQTVANMSEATKTLDALIREGRMHHPENDVLTWMIGNVVGHFDAKDNVYPRKEFANNKIDGAIALIMALGWFVANKEDKPVTPWDEDPKFSLVGDK